MPNQVPGFPADDGMRVVVIPPMGRAYTAFIDDDLDAMQGIVGGNIQVISDIEIGLPDTRGRAIDLWCNEEFLYAPDMVFNRALARGDGTMMPVYGPMFCCGLIPITGASCGLSTVEAISVLEDGRACIADPQILIPSGGEAFAVPFVCGAGETALDLMADLPSQVLQANGILPSSEDIGLLVQMPLVGKPESIMAGKWRIRLVHPGDRYGLENRLVYDHADAGEHGMGLPMVEFYDMSQPRSSWPEGQFVERYYMTTLMNLDGRSPGCPRGAGLESRKALALYGGVSSWTISGDDYQTAASFIARAHAACLRERARSAACERGTVPDPSAIARAAALSAEGRLSDRPDVSKRNVL